MKLVSWYIALQGFFLSISKKLCICLLVVLALIFYISYVFLKKNRQPHNHNEKNNELVLTSLSDALKGRNMVDAYKMSEQILTKRCKQLDHITLNLISQQSAIAWFNIKVFCTSKLISLLGIVLCIEMKGTLSNTALFMITNFAMNL